MEKFRCLPGNRGIRGEKEKKEGQESLRLTRGGGKEIQGNTVLPNKETIQNRPYRSAHRKSEWKNLPGRQKGTSVLTIMWRKKIRKEKKAHFYKSKGAVPQGTENPPPH